MLMRHKKYSRLYPYLSKIGENGFQKYGKQTLQYGQE